MNRILLVLSLASITIVGFVDPAHSGPKYRGSAQTSGGTRSTDSPFAPGTVTLTNAAPRTGGNAPGLTSTGSANSCADPFRRA